MVNDKGLRICLVHDLRQPSRRMPKVQRHVRASRGQSTQDAGKVDQSTVSEDGAARLSIRVARTDQSVTDTGGKLMQFVV